ncbi:hypothetical protein [Mycolicibacterium septicum]|uniref:hypothetical protein n=1 Tax=Mycolicibacterium septicum TaxID=98668 RepID=UPI001AF4B23B|nr:hypothetical protein [Mycolicibacterium septicum]QRY51807.1 hypothetical protein JVX95_31285 [Mycolicibacterium septicum]
MLELYALESRLRAEVDRLVSDMRGSPPYTIDASSWMQRMKIFRLMCGEERSFTIKEEPLPSFKEMWAAAGRAKCFDCSGAGCTLIGETFAFCDEDCRDSFMASLYA